MADGICNNCGASLAGPYCHRCGQKEADTDWRSFGSITRQFWTELVNLDFKTVHTVGALFRPGHLAAEFIAGRRARYLSPLKTYLLAAALFFLIAPRVTDFGFERQMELDQEGSFRARVEARIAATGVRRDLFAERFNTRLQTIYTLSPIVSVVAATFILRLLYGRRFRWPGPHAVFALYHVAFMFVTALAVHALSHEFNGVNLVILLIAQFAVVAPYMVAALQRVYGEPAKRTAWKTAVLLLLTFVMDIPINMAAVLLSVQLS